MSSWVKYYCTFHREPKRMTTVLFDQKSGGKVVSSMSVLLFGCYCLSVCLSVCQLSVCMLIVCHLNVSCLFVCLSGLCLSAARHDNRVHIFFACHSFQSFPYQKSLFLCIPHSPLLKKVFTTWGTHVIQCHTAIQRLFTPRQRRTGQ